MWSSELVMCTNCPRLDLPHATGGKEEAARGATATAAAAPPSKPSWASIVKSSREGAAAAASKEGAPAAASPSPIPALSNPTQTQASEGVGRAGLGQVVQVGAGSLPTNPATPTPSLPTPTRLVGAPSRGFGGPLTPLPHLAAPPQAEDSNRR
jgi:hypothetical protein